MGVPVYVHGTWPSVGHALCVSAHVQVVVMDTTPGGHASPDHTPSTVLVNMGDPVRKNSLCVEISAASGKVRGEGGRK